MQVAASTWLNVRWGKESLVPPDGSHARLALSGGAAGSGLIYLYPLYRFSIEQGSIRCLMNASLSLERQ